MNVVEVIRERVLEIANLRNDVPFIHAFVIKFRREDEYFDLQHHLTHFDKTGETRGCGCKYCLTLFKYVETIRSKHRLNKKLEREDDIGPLASHIFIHNTVAKLSETHKELREKMVILSETLEIPNTVKRKTA